MPTVAPFHFGDYVEHVAFVDNNPAFACADGVVRIYTDLGERVVEAHEGLTCAALTLDGKGLVTGGEDGNVCLVTCDGEFQSLAATGSKWITAVAAGPNGSVGWSVGREASVRQANGHVRSFVHERSVEDLAFAPKGQRIAASRYNGADLHWAGTDASSQSLEWAGAHNAIQFSPDGRYLITSMQENALHGWRLADERHMRMSGYPTKVKSMSFSAKGNWLATSGANSAVVWPFSGKDGPMGKMPKELGHRGDSLVTCVACHPSDDAMVLGYADGMVAAVSIDAGQDAVLRRPGTGEVTSIAWDMNGVRIVFGTESGEAGLIDLT